MNAERRKKALELLRRIEVSYLEINHSSVLEPYWDTAMEDITELRSLLSESDWVPVSERMPEEDDHCLVCSESGARDKALYFCGRWVGTRLKNIVAWQPLPEPPEDECNEQS